MIYQALEAIVKTIDADSAAIMVPDETERVLFCYDSFNMPAEWVAIKNSFDEEVPGGTVEVYKTGEPAISNHLQKTLKSYYVESVMIVPIRRDEKTIATLELIHVKDNKAFNEDDRRQAEEFVKQISFKKGSSNVTH